MAGTWQYTEGSVQIPAAAADEPPTLELKRKNEHAYSGALRVINNISVGLTRDGSSDPWTGRVGASTMMGGPEEEMALERRMIELLSESGPLNLELEGTDKLTLLGTGGASGIWKRISVVPKAVDWNPFQP
jgi:heat shock protein HslJ